MSAANETVEEVAVEMLAEMRRARQELQGVNDYGHVLGLVEEYDQLKNDFAAQLGALRARAYRLRRRAEQFHREKAEAGK